MVFDPKNPRQDSRSAQLAAAYASEASESNRVLLTIDTTLREPLILDVPGGYRLYGVDSKTIFYTTRYTNDAGAAITGERAVPTDTTEFANPTGTTAGKLVAGDNKISATTSIKKSNKLPSDSEQYVLIEVPNGMIKSVWVVATEATSTYIEGPFY